MRILLLADIHSNWPALRTIEDKYDVCICLGDLVEYGLQPGPCIEWVRENARYVVRGNHDHGLAQNVAVNARAGYKLLTELTRKASLPLLDEEERRYLARLPITRMITLDGTRFLLVHATPRDPLDEYGPPEEQFWKRRLENVDADVICVGHTHQQFVLEVGNKLVINPGSVGQPRDGDPRLAYAILEGKRLELKRLEYPVEETVQVIEQSELPDDPKQHLCEIFRNGGSQKASAKNNGA